MRQTAFPQSLTHGEASARIHELRRQAERQRLVRSAPSRRRSVGTPAWSASLVAALRESLTGSSSRQSARRAGADPCVACA